MNNKELVIPLDNEKTSEEFAGKLALHVSAPLILGFSGDIGTGKTTIIRSMLKQMGIESAIKSPTFSLVESYECQSITIHHFDLYRIHTEDELQYLGFRDFFKPDSICCIEWIEHAANLLPSIDIQFNLSIKGSGREMHLVASTVAGETILACLAGES